MTRLKNYYFYIRQLLTYSEKKNVIYWAQTRKQQRGENKNTMSICKNTFRLHLVRYHVKTPTDLPSGYLSPTRDR